MKRSIDWDGTAVVAVDQTALPAEYRTARLESVDALVMAIRSLTIRGAPAIGVAAALGVAMSARAHAGRDGVDEPAVHRDAERLAAARPTAANLGWGVERALARLPEGPEAVLAEALGMLDEDELTNRAASGRAAALVRRLCPDRPLRLLTHCNTGALATVAWGTALGTVRELAAAGRVAEVLVDETRPLLQGSRLTVWELARAGVPHRLCVDSAGPAAIGAGLIDCVLVGADRVAANGDVANKIGTYALAIAARRAGIPFVVVAPESTLDPRLAGGHEITVEHRAAEEVTAVGGTPVAPAGTEVYNPAFDITPADLVTAVVTERRELRGSAAADIAATARALYQRGWMDGTAGNLSVFAPGRDDAALVTASGRSKGELTPGDVVLIRTADGAAAEPEGLRPSAEACIHAAIYRSVPGCGAVVHAHPPYATVLSARAGRAGRAEVRFDGWELAKGLGGAGADGVSVPLFTNWPDVSRIATEVAAWVSDRTVPPALLIAGHGVTTWGPDLATARNRMECVEALCRLHLTDAGIPSRPDPGTGARASTEETR